MRVIFINKVWLFVLWVLLGVLLALLYITKIYDDQSIATFGSPTYGKVIVIDAGHGGIDPGATSPSGTREDKLNLAIAKKLRSYLEHEGAKVVMTRKTDKGLSNRKSQDMHKRVEIIRKSNPNIVISIHMNKFGQSKYYGAQTFYMKGSQEGKVLARCIQDQLIRVLDRGNTRDIKAANNFLILKADEAPSVIVECGFLSNPAEEKLLKTDSYQEKVAWAIYSGIVDYFTRP